MTEIKFSGDYLEMDDLPHNCIFNKVKTGCGGTTIALKNEENYVIAVPYTEVIVNKTGRSDAGMAEWVFGEGETKVVHSVFGLFGPFSECKTEFVRYVSTDGVKKIICTYDKVPLLKQYIAPEDYRLLVDEYQQLLKAYSYRNKAIDGVLDNFRLFKSFCFMSATPIQPDFKPDCLADVEEIKAEWDDIEPLHVEIVPTDKPYLKAANLITRYRTQGYIEVCDHRNYEAFFFINSVTDIASILAHCQLSPDEVKIICSDREANKYKLPGYQIENSRTPPKKFTFLTSKSFEGADYFSPTGIAFVVSSASNPNTLLSVDTDIPQISGRIRDSYFKNLVVHFVAPNLYNRYSVTYHEFQQKLEADMEMAKRVVEFYNQQPEDQRGNIEKLFKCNRNYIHYDEDTKIYSVNDKLIKLELYNYRTYQEVYKSSYSLRRYYQNQGNDVTMYRFEKISEDIDKACQLPTFKDVYLALSEYQKNRPHFAGYPPKLRLMLELQPLVERAYNELGDDVVASLRYTKSKVEDALDARDRTQNQYNQVASILSRKLEPGFISSKELKMILDSAYKTVRIEDRATAKHIKKWYDVSDLPKYRKINGKTVRGYELYHAKILSR